MPQLVIVDPQGEEECLELEGDAFVLGREDSATIPLHDRKVSRKHARIFLRGQHYWIEDLGSANGVLIAGSVITGPRQLFSGTELEIGPFHLTYFEDSAAEEDAFSLVGITEPCIDHSFVLPRGELGVGRVDTNAILLVDSSVSRQHARLTVTADALVVEDLDSRNGTYVNGTKVGRRKLAVGDRVRFGNVELEVQGAGGGIGDGVLAQLARTDASTKLAIGLVGLAALLGVATGIVLIARHHNAPGVGPLERAYARDLASGLAAAGHAMQRASWDEAASLYQQVLDKDPINTKARHGLYRAQTNSDEERAVKAAKADLQNNQPSQVLRDVAGIPTSAHYGPAAASLAQQARAKIAAQALAAAQQDCQAQQWKACHSEIVRHLDNQPDSVEGKALVTEAEDAMRARNIPFTPWAPPPDSVTDNATSDNGSGTETLEGRYTDTDVRDAALRYAAGDLDTAIQRARSYVGRPKAAELSAALADFRSAKTAGDGAAIAGDMDRAVHAWQRALAADAKIIPAGHASAFRDQLRRRLGLELSRQGTTAYNDGSYVEAFQDWRDGLGYDPSNADILAGLAKLEVHAEKMLARIGTPQHPDPDTCADLASIIGMTRAQADVHKKASALHNACK